MIAVARAAVDLLLYEGKYRTLNTAERSNAIMLVGTYCVQQCAMSHMIENLFLDTLLKQFTLWCTQRGVR